MMRRLWRRLTTSSVADGAAAAQPELQADVLRLVLAQLDGDVSALCASACVSTQWRDVLLLPPAAALWRQLRVPPRVAARLTDARLQTLVARARGALQRLDVSGCTQLTNAGLAAAVARQRNLAHVAAVGCDKLSVEGVVRALKGRKLTTLRVRGIETSQDFLDLDGRAAAMVAPDLAQLRKRLRPPHDLDATAGCTFVTEEAEHGYADDELCGCLYLRGGGPRVRVVRRVPLRAPCPRAPHGRRGGALRALRRARVRALRGHRLDDGWLRTALVPLLRRAPLPELHLRPPRRRIRRLRQV
jgi:hypothetical protein